MAPGVFTDSEWNYVQEHLRILSGFYGIVRPMDGIIPYRLEMQAKLSGNGYSDLYEFWGDSMYRSLYRANDMVINLASKEYSLAVERYLQPADRFINVTFGVIINEKVRVKATWAKGRFFWRKVSVHV